MSAIRLAVVGAGAMGRLHARAIARRAQRFGDCVLAVIVDRHVGRSERVAAEFGGFASDSLDALRDGVDAAVVAVPTHAHDEIARALLRAGLDILIEKPMSTSALEARSIEELARSQGRVLGVGHVEWYNPQLREAIRKAGAPRRIDVERLNPGIERGLDIDVVQDFMLHDLDWIARIVADELVEVSAHGRAIVNDAIDEAEAELRFAKGCRARLRASRVHSERVRSVEIEGAEATVRVDLLPAQTAIAPAAEWAEVLEPLDAEWADFLEACRSREAPENDALVGIAAIELVERVRGAIRLQPGSAARDHDPALGR